MAETVSASVPIFFARIASPPADTSETSIDTEVPFPLLLLTYTPLAADDEPAVTAPAAFTVMAPAPELVAEIPWPADAVTALTSMATPPPPALIAPTPTEVGSATLKPSPFVVDPMAETLPVALTETSPPPLL